MKILFNLPYLHCFVFLCGWLVLNADAMEWNINDYPLDQRKLTNYDIQTFEKQFSTPGSEGHCHNTFTPLKTRLNACTDSASGSCGSWLRIEAN